MIGKHPDRYYEIDSLDLDYFHFGMMLAGYAAASYISNFFVPESSKHARTSSEPQHFAISLWETVAGLLSPCVPYVLIFFVLWSIFCIINSHSKEDPLVGTFIEYVTVYATYAGIVYTLAGGRNWLLWVNLLGGFIGLAIARKNLKVWPRKSAKD